MSACRAPRRPFGRRRTPLLAAGVALAALTLSACGDGTSGGSAETRFVQGKNGVDTVPAADRQPAPKIDGTTLDDKKLDIADYKGDVVILNIWGSYCGPCIAEAPNFAKVHNDTKDKGVKFVGINTRDAEKSQAITFEEEHGVPYPSIYDPMGKLMLRFPKGSLNPQAIPTTIAIDREGRVAARSLTALSEEDLRRMVEPLIAEK